MAKFRVRNFLIEVNRLILRMLKLLIQWRIWNISILRRKRETLEFLLKARNENCYKKLLLECTDTDMSSRALLWDKCMVGNRNVEKKLSTALNVKVMLFEMKYRNETLRSWHSVSPAHAYALAILGPHSQKLANHNCFDATWHAWMKFRSFTCIAIEMIVAIYFFLGICQTESFWLLGIFGCYRSSTHNI